MARLAGQIIIDHDTRTLTIDGTRFPWAIDDDGPTVHRDTDGLHTVTLAILVEDVVEHVQPTPTPGG